MKDYPTVVQKQLSHLVDCNQRPQAHVRVDVEVVKFHIIREVPSKRLVLPAQRRLVHQCTHQPLRVPRGILHLSKQVPQQRNNSTDTAHPEISAALQLPRQFQLNSPPRQFQTVAAAAFLQNEQARTELTIMQSKHMHRWLPQAMYNYEWRQTEHVAQSSRIG